MLGERRHQARKYTIEHRRAEILGNTRLPEAALVTCDAVKTAALAGLWKEGVAAEQQIKHTQVMPRVIPTFGAERIALQT